MWFTLLRENYSKQVELSNWELVFTILLSQSYSERDRVSDQNILSCSSNERISWAAQTNLFKFNKVKMIETIAVWVGQVPVILRHQQIMKEEKSEINCNLNNY